MSTLVGHPLRDCIEYFVVGRNSVEGFLLPGAAGVIASLLEAQYRDGVRGNIAEIGVYHGKLFIGLALSMRPDEKAVAVDCFRFNGREFEGIFRKNLEKFHIPQEHSVIVRGNSLEMTIQDWKRHLGAPARFVHVDGDHTKAAVLHDLSLAASHLAPDGLIVIDDLFHPWYPDITEGVYDFLRGHPELVPVALLDRSGSVKDGCTKLVLSGRGFQKRYMQAIEQAHRSNITLRVPFCGEQALSLGFDNGVNKALLIQPTGVETAGRPGAKADPAQ